MLELGQSSVILNSLYSENKALSKRVTVIWQVTKEVNNENRSQNPQVCHGDYTNQMIIGTTTGLISQILPS